MFEYLQNNFFLGNSYLRWVMTFNTVVVTILLSQFMYWLGNGPVRRWTEKSETKLDDLLLSLFHKPFITAIILTGIWIALYVLEFPEKIDLYINNIYKVLVVLNVTWFIVHLIQSVCQHYIQPMVDDKDKKIDSHVLSTLNKIIGYLGWTIGIITALEVMGVDIAALLTTLGIGGVAIAFAAQDTVKNIIGGITVFTDRPFRIGDRIKISGFEGYVEDLGMRSTRLRSLDGRQVIIPNYKLVDSDVENVSREPSRRIVSTLGLVYGTSPEKMEEAMNILRSLPQEITSIKQDITASFTSFGDFSLNITFIYFIRKSKDIYQTQNEVNMAVLKKFNEAGLDFAFPSQTLYIEK